MPISRTFVAKAAMGVIVLGGGLASGAGRACAQTPALQVQHAAARLVVVAEPRTDVAVTVQHGPSRLPSLTVRREWGRLVVDGGLGGPFGGDRVKCLGGHARAGGPPRGRADEASFPDARAVIADNVGRVAYRDLPVITAHVPLDAHVAASSAVWVEMGPTRSLTLAATGCGDWQAGPVAGPLDAVLTGSGQVDVADAGSVRGHLAGSGGLRVGAVRGAADLSVAGSGDMAAGAVSGPVKLGIAGSGDISLERVSAPVDAHIAASGDIRIHGGRAPDVHVNLVGSGDFSFDGEAGRLTAGVVGSGDVRVAAVTGPVSKNVVGSGEVTIGR